MRLGVGAALVEHLLPGDVEVQAGVVTAVGVGAPGGDLVAAPGLVDLQVNGFAGVDLMTPTPTGTRGAGAALLATGVTAFQPTFVTAPEDVLVAALRAMPVAAGAPRVIGAHLEGPFLSPGASAPTTPQARREPDLGLLRRLLDARAVSQ